MAHNSSIPQPVINPNISSIRPPRESGADQTIITAYGPKIRQQLTFSGPGKTKQSFKDECDINRIMARYQVTGVLPEQLQPGSAQYVDVTGIDYMEGMQKIAAAQSLFQGLPAHVRLKFENDPGKFLDFAQDPTKQDELVQLGLATRPPHAPLELDTSQAPAEAARAATARSSSGKGKGGDLAPPNQTLPGIPDSEK